MPGRYVVAVSGGVDSVALLDMLNWRRQAEPDKGWRLTVAHYDHGIRDDAIEDRRLVQQLARKYGLPFVYAEGALGKSASEAAARKARYGFLDQVLRASNSQAIVTAHHQDDVLETAILNLIRGTGRKGLTSLSNRHGVMRPLLKIPKADLIDYANNHHLEWREDSTNQDETYLRNYIRHRIMPRIGNEPRGQLLDIIDRLREVNGELDELLVDQLHLQSVAGTIDRQWFIGLPHKLAREVMAAWLRAHGERDFDRRTLERLVVSAKISQPDRVFPITKATLLRIGRDKLALEHVER